MYEKNLIAGETRAVEQTLGETIGMTVDELSACVQLVDMLWGYAFEPGADLERPRKAPAECLLADADAALELSKELMEKLKRFATAIGLNQKL